MHSTKTLIQDSLEGKFGNVHNEIVRNSLTLETSSALKILVAVCNACHEKKPNIEICDLVALVKCLLKSIEAPTTEQFQRYAQSSFHILKYLINQKRFDSIIELEDLLVPHFTPKEHILCLNICRIVYNAIANFGQNKTENKHVTKLCYLLLKMYKKLNKEGVLVEFVHNCVQILIALNTRTEDLVRFYQNLTQSTEFIENPAIFVLIIKTLSALYTHLLGKEEFEQASVCYKVTVKHLSRLKGTETGLLIDMMSVAEWFNPNNLNLLTKHNFSEATSQLLKYCRRYNLTGQSQKVWFFITSVISAAAILYKKSDIWTRNLDFHPQCYQYLYKLSEIVAQTEISCNCKCSTVTNLNEAARLLFAVVRLGRLTILNRHVSSEYTVKILFYLEKLSDFVTILKGNKCAFWRNFFLDLVVVFYSIGCHLYHGEKELCLLYLEKFITTCLDFEGCLSKVVYKANLVSALNVISDIYLENGNFGKCLLTSGLALIASESPKNEINRWIKAKSGSRNNNPNCDLQELTLVSICERFQNEPIFGKSQIVLTTERKLELLVYELRQYQMKWKSKTPMTATFKELSRIADTQTSAEIFIEIWGDGEMSIHENLPKLLRDTIRRVESDKIPKKNLLLAHLYFLQHRYRIKDTVLKHCDEMEKTIINKTDYKIQGAMVPSDPNDECDLVSSYESLKINRYVTMMKELNQSLRLSHDWVWQEKTDPTDVDRLFKLLSNIGYEYHLHGLVTKSLEAWELALTIARIVDNPLYKLQAAGFILELADVRKPLVQKLILEAEEGIDKLRTNSNFDVLITYFLCKAEGFFHVDFDTAHSAFRQALNFQGNCEGNGLLQARIHLVHHKFTMLPCHYEVADHREFSLVKIHQANQSVNSYYSSSHYLSSYDMRILFEIYENLARMYHDLHRPREVRCYTKDSIVIAQKMILPFRTMSLLYYLAYADVTTHRLDDGRVKIKDFSEILCLSDNPVEQTKDKESIDILIEDFNEMMLDVPKRTQESTCTGSPVFDVETFKLPSFLNHNRNCQCLYCISLECQEFVIRVTFLKAMLYQYDGKVHMAKEFFCGCLKIYECLKHKEQFYEEKLHSRISNDLIPLVRDKLIEIHCVSLMEYGNLLIRNKKHKDAEKLSGKVLETIETLSLQTKFVHLYNEVLLQMLTILSLQEEAAEPSNCLSVASETLGDSMKTPPTGASTVLLSPNWKTTEPTKNKVLPKSLKFDLSEEEDSKPVKKVHQVKNVPAFLNLGVATPAPSTSKIKIYSESTKKTTKLVPLECTPFKEPASVSEGTVEKKNNDALALRTKLLTERLKSSSRKKAPAKERDENVKSGVKKKSVQQNLMKQLDEAETETKPRRSARNIK